VAADIELIYCAGSNRMFAQIAIDAGFLYGAQLPSTVYHSLHFADQNWKNPDRGKYISALAKHRPFMASVLDFERMEQLPEVLAWAEDAAQYIEVVIIIPKVFGGISKLPSVIGGKPIRLGYSVPTKHGGTSVGYSEFVGWPVHLLGGSPQKQMRLTRYLNVVSIDGNMHMKMAIRYNAFFDPEKITVRGYWPTLKDYDGQKWGDGSKKSGAPYEAFRRSCVNIMSFWQDRFIYSGINGGFEVAA